MKTKLIFTIFLFAVYISTSVVYAQLKPELVLPVGHTACVKFAIYNHNGKYIVSASDDNTVKIWDAESGKLLHSLIGHLDHIKSAIFSPDGKTIVSTSHFTNKIWDVESGKLLHTLEDNNFFFNHTTFSPDGKTFVTASYNAVKIWDTESGKLLRTLKKHKKAVNYATYSPNGKSIVTASNDKTARIWDVESGKLLHSLKGHVSPVVSALYGTKGKTIVTASKDGTAKIWNSKNGKLLHSLKEHTSAVDFATYSPDGRTIVTTYDDFTAKIWDAESGKLLHSLKEVYAWEGFVQYSPDSKTIVSGSSLTARIWDIESGKLLHTLKGHKGYIFSAIYSPDGKTIVTASDDKTIKIWDVKSGKLLYSLKGYNNSVYSATFSPNGQFFAIVSSDTSVKISDTENGKILNSLTGHLDLVNTAAFSPDGETIITTSKDSTAKIWNTKSGKLLHSLEGHVGGIYFASYSSNGKYIVTASEDRKAKLWNVENGRLLHSFIGHRDEVTCATYSPNGKSIATTSWDHTAKIWDTESGELLHTLEGHTRGVVHAFYSNNGKTIVTVSTDNTVKTWDVESGKPLLSVKIQDDDFGYNTTDFSPNGKTKASISCFNDPARIWDLESGNLLHTLKGHNGIVTTAIYSPDGKTIVTASEDNTAKIWDTQSGLLLHSLERHSNVINSAVYSMNGKTIITAASDGSAIIWDAGTGKMLVQQFCFGKNETISLTENGLFDATPAAMKKMYYVQGLEIIEMSQLKDRYWEPDLWRKVMAGEELREVEAFDESLPLFPKIENLVIKEESIEFDLLEQGGGIGKYFIFINGKEAFVGNELKHGEVYKDSILIVNFNFKNHEYLLPGDSNKITVKAYNAESWIISKGVNILYSNKKKEKEIVKPNIFIVSCGVSDYTGNQIDLRYAAKDAEDISKSLQLGAEQLFGTDNTFQYLLSTNGEKENWPTKENIENVFKEIGKKAKSTDIIVVYLSGHGINWGGQDGDFYYLTQDAYTASGDAYNDPTIRKASTISSNELVELFKLVPANKQVLIIDACASGQVVEDLLVQRDISSSTIRALDRMKDRTGLYIITGSAADAVSYEASKYGQGLLTYSLLEGIKGAALREGQFIDVDVLFQRAKDRVPQLAEGIGGIQQPQVFFPYGSASFDIGLLTETEKEKIPLAKEKPVFVMSTFMDADSFDDVLGLENLVDEELRTASAKGSEAILIFYETRNFPDAYRLRGLYTISGNEITLNLNVFYGKEKIESMEIKGDKNEMEGFVSKVIEKASTGTY